MKSLLSARRHPKVVVGVTAAIATLLATSSSPSAQVTFSAGAGTVNGTVTYSTGSEPGALAQCSAGAAWAFGAGGASGNAVVLHLHGDFYAGPVQVTGGGTMGCESAAIGQGSVSFGFTAINPIINTASFSCPAMGGQWIRLAAIAVYEAQGNCTIDGVNDGITQIGGVGQWTPSGTSPFTQTSSSATLASVWAIVNVS